MKIDTNEITKDTFNELLQRQTDQLNQIRNADILQIDEGEAVDWHEINRAMIQNAARFRALGRPYGKMRKLEMQAKKWYLKTKLDAMLEVVKPELRKVYSSEELRKAYAEGEAQDDFERWQSVKVMVECVHIERQDCYDYSNRLEKIAQNARAEAYANR